MRFGHGTSAADTSGRHKRGRDVRRGRGSVVMRCVGSQPCDGGPAARGDHHLLWSSPTGLDRSQRHPTCWQPPIGQRCTSEGDTGVLLCVSVGLGGFGCLALGPWQLEVARGVVGRAPCGLWDLAARKLLCGGGMAWAPGEGGGGGGGSRNGLPCRALCFV